MPPPHFQTLDRGQTAASVAGNVLEWYDFSVFGYLSDILGEVFFPPSEPEEESTEYSYLVFGLAFFMRPVGGALLGYVGDKYGRKKALVLSIFLMAFPTFIMGTLPGYKTVGGWAIVFLIVVRLLQGLSVGGQLVSSLVFLLEHHHPAHWGFYGSFAMSAALFGSFLGAITSFILRATLTHAQLVQWGWRIPFLLGILVSYFGFYLRSHGDDYDGAHVPQPLEHSEEDINARVPPATNDENDIVYSMDTTNNSNPFVEAFSRHNRRSLLAASLVPMLWASGFYLFFVWMAVFMNELISNPVPGAFLISSVSLLLSVCLSFPFAGWMSDCYGRVRIMTIGGILMLVLSPLLVMAIGRGNPAVALISQCALGISLSLFSAPMCAWLVEAFDPRARLTSVAIGYNLAQAIAGGSTPALATLITEQLGPRWPGWIVTVVAIASLFGLLCVSPKPSLSHNPSTTLPRKTSDGLSRAETISDQESGTLHTT